MQLLQKTIIMLFLFVAVLTYTPPEDQDPCNCDHCEEDKVEGKETKDRVILEMYKEDSDGDGNRTICARDRDFDDRTFPSVCHMLCHNRCPTLRLSTVTEDNTKKHGVNVYRSNYYKLRNGEC